MKQIKNFISALISFLVIAMMFSTPAYAEDPTYTIAVRNETSGYTYEAYQLFSGTYASDKLADITWGSSITEEGKTALFTKYNIPANNRTAEAVAEALDGETEAGIRELAKVLNTTTGALSNAISMPYSESIVIGSAAAFKGYAASGLHAGYYLVVNKSIPAGGDNVYSDYIVQLVKDVAVEPKSDKPSSLKKVKDKNDSDTNSQYSALQDSADYNIGDKVPFTLTATLPADFDKYDQYYLKIEDDMSKGLTLDKTFKIFYGAEDTTGDTVSPSVSQELSSFPDGSLYSYTIPDLKDMEQVLTGGDVIRIEYTATLTSDAVIGSAGNPNKYRIEFSNNPNQGGLNGPKGTTPWDENVVFTYKTIFNKIDNENNPLTGADFKLEKLVGGTYTDVTTLGTSSNHPTKTGSTSGSTFTFSGLADGQYRLTEITTPAGYNTISPIVFTISAQHDTASDHPTLISLSGTDGDSFTMSADETAGSLSANIVNKAGIALPSTGGTGTALFRIAGVAVVILAGFFFVSSGRKKH